MKRIDWFALGLALLAVIAAYLVSNRVFENLAHVEDEQAFVWQAAVLAGGHLTLPSPPQSHSFLWPFVIDYQGQQALTSQLTQASLRFGKYPLGWPLVLSAGVVLGIRDWINPLLAGLGVWLTYLLGKRTFTPLIGLLAAGLTLTSPFFLIVSGSLFSHPLGLVLSAGFALAWLNAFFRPDQDDAEEYFRYFRQRAWWSAILGGLALGFLFFTRPWTAVAVGLPFGVHGIILLVRGSRTTRLQVVALGAIAVLVGALQFGWQWLATGNPLTNLYTLWWPYDKVGFGPGYGVSEAGHTLTKGVRHMLVSLKDGFPDLFGWWKISWIFLPFGLWAAWKLTKQSSRCAAFLILSPFLSLVLFHLAYWVGSYLLGPRYYYEGLFGLTIFSAAGIAWLAGWPITIQTQPQSDQAAPPSSRLRTPEVPEVSFRIFRPEVLFRRLRAILVPAFVIGLVCYNLFFYLPGRLKPLYGLYGVSRSNLEPFLTEQAQALTPAIVIVHIREKWIEYGTLLELQSPYLDSPFIFVISRGEEDDRKVASYFPERRVIHYYPDDPENFFDTPQNK
jgi:hypothetical protein